MKIIRVEKKNRKHPHWGKGSQMGYLVNSKPGGDIILHFRYEYKIDLTDVSVRDHPFFITRPGEAQYGGKHNGKEYTVFERFPTNQGVVSFTPEIDFNLTKKERDNLSNGTAIYRMYYACDNHPFMGGDVYIVGKSLKIEIADDDDFVYLLLPKIYPFTTWNIPTSVGVTRLTPWKQMVEFTGEIAFVKQHNDDRFLYVGEKSTGIVWEVDMFTTIRGFVDDDDDDPLSHAGMWAEKRMLINLNDLSSGGQEVTLHDMLWIGSGFVISAEIGRGGSVDVIYSATYDREGSVLLSDKGPPTIRTTYDTPHGAVKILEYKYNGDRSPRLRGHTVQIPVVVDNTRIIAAFNERKEVSAIGELPEKITGGFQIRETTEDFAGEVFVVSYNGSTSTIWQIQWD
jgi:hypothetical protein